MSIVTKSGTSEIHGAVFRFHQSDNLDTRNFFNRMQSGFMRNQFEFSVSEGRFFGTTDWWRERLGRTTVTIVPTAEARPGRLTDPANPGRFITISSVSIRLSFRFSTRSQYGRDLRASLAEFSFPFAQKTKRSSRRERIAVWVI